MNDNFSEKIISLLKEGKKDEARDLIKAEITSEMSSEEKGAFLTEIAMTYMRTINNLNENYLAELESILNELRSIDEVESKVGDEIKLNAVKKTLDI